MFQEFSTLSILMIPFLKFSEIQIQRYNYLVEMSVCSLMYGILISFSIYNHDLIYNNFLGKE